MTVPVIAPSGMITDAQTSTAFIELSYAPHLGKYRAESGSVRPDLDDFETYVANYHASFEAAAADALSQAHALIDAGHDDPRGTLAAFRDELIMEVAA